MILGIDPGTSCGWSVITADGRRAASGVVDLSSRRHEGGGMRFVRFRAVLKRLIDEYEIEAVAYEEVARHRGVAAAHVYGGLIAVLQAECELAGMPYSGIPVGTVKKVATGKGNSGKELMVESARARWSLPGWLPGHDEADACWVAESLRMEIQDV